MSETAPEPRPASAALVNSPQGLLRKIQLVELHAWSRVGPHRALADRWGRVATALGWAAAFTASISTLSIFADYTVAAISLAITTAALTAFMATVKPAEIAASHHNAAVGFAAIQDAMRDLAFDFQDSGVQAAQVPVVQTMYDALYVRFQKLTESSTVQPESLAAAFAAPPSGG